MKADQELARVHVRLKGRVQGVGFRYFVQRTAADLALTGWVRNRWDRSVEVVAEGPRPQLERLLQALRSGPRGARVDEAAAEWGAATGEFTRFLVRRTA